jgi:ribosomal protein L40E
MAVEQRYTFRNGYRRARSSAVEYGHTCPVCSSPKTPQALRCRRCFAETLIREVTAFETAAR